MALTLFGNETRARTLKENEKKKNLHKINKTEHKLMKKKKRKKKYSFQKCATINKNIVP